MAALTPTSVSRAPTLVPNISAAFARGRCTICVPYVTNAMERWCIGVFGAQTGTSRHRRSRAGHSRPPWPHAHVLASATATLPPGPHLLPQLVPPSRLRLVAVSPAQTTSDGFAERSWHLRRRKCRDYRHGRMTPPRDVGYVCCVCPCACCCPGSVAVTCTSPLRRLLAHYRVAPRAGLRCSDPVTLVLPPLPRNPTPNLGTSAFRSRPCVGGDQDSCREGPR